MFNTDKPIDNINSDLLNRASFSKQLAKSILSYTDTDNFTISLCGKWGSGKTSILNMIEAYINELTIDYDEDNKPIIVHFNPWNYTDQDQLITQFFSTIIAKLGVGSKSQSLNKVGKVLQEYADIFEYADLIPVAGKYAKFAKWVIGKTGKKLSKGNDNNLNKKKEEVTNALMDQNHKFIVIIDDIDRLNNSQIKLIFQLVNSLAGFPNLIYLLSFDREVVVRALSEEQNCNGEEYLEKIIQIPFDIPEAKGELVHKVLFGKLENLWFKGSTCDNFETEYWHRVFNCCVSPFIKNIRDVNRIINVYRFKYGLMHEETNCIDLLAITTLLVCAPEIYNWIYTNLDDICGSSYAMGISGVEQKENYNNRLEEFEEIYDNPELMIQIIQSLFPKFSRQTGGYYHSSDIADELRKKQKIACDSRAELYFNLSLDDVVISKREIIETINNYDNVRLKEYFDALIDDDKIFEYSRELLSYVNDIPKDRKTLFIHELARVLAFSATHKSQGALNPTSSTYITYSIWEILKSYSKDEASEEIIKLLNSNSIDVFSIAISIILQIEKSYGRIGDDINSEYKVISEEQLNGIEIIAKQKLKDFSEKVNLLDLNFFLPVHIFWSYIDKNSLNTYLCEQLDKSSNVPKFLKIKAHNWVSSRGNEISFNKEEFDNNLSTMEAYNRILSLKSTFEFNQLDKESKRIAVAYYLWYGKFNEKYVHIDVAKVDELINDWEYTP